MPTNEEAFQLIADRLGDLLKATGEAAIGEPVSRKEYDMLLSIVSVLALYVKEIVNDAD